MSFLKAVSLICFLSILSACASKRVVVSRVESNLSAEARIQRAYVRRFLLKEERIYDSLASLPESAIKDTIDCGTRLTFNQYEVISDVFANVCRPELFPGDDSTVLIYPLHFFFATKQGYDYVLPDVQVRRVVESLNDKFQSCGIQFVLSGIDTLVSQRLFDFRVRDEMTALRRSKENAISIFVFNSISDNNLKINGYARMSEGADFVMLTNDGLFNGTTFHHELGHYFLLYHTHGKSNLGSTDETVARGNCSCSGDDICDTPADPNLKKWIDQNCSYNGNVKDISGALYNPDPTNLMSYAINCRKQFSYGQYRRMRWAAINFRRFE